MKNTLAHEDKDDDDKELIHQLKLTWGVVVSIDVTRRYIDKGQGIVSHLLTYLDWYAPRFPEIPTVFHFLNPFTKVEDGFLRRLYLIGWYTKKLPRDVWYSLQLLWKRFGISMWKNTIKYAQTKHIWKCLKGYQIEASLNITERDNKEYAYLDDEVGLDIEEYRESFLRKDNPKEGDDGFSWQNELCWEDHPELRDSWSVGEHWKLVGILNREQFEDLLYTLDLLPSRCKTAGTLGMPGADPWYSCSTDIDFINDQEGILINMRAVPYPANEQDSKLLNQHFPLCGETDEKKKQGIFDEAEQFFWNAYENGPTMAADDPNLHLME